MVPARPASRYIQVPNPITLYASALSTLAWCPSPSCHVAGGFGDALLTRLRWSPVQVTGALHQVGFTYPPSSGLWPRHPHLLDLVKQVCLCVDCCAHVSCTDSQHLTYIFLIPALHPAQPGVSCRARNADPLPGSCRLKARSRDATSPPPAALS